MNVLKSAVLISGTIFIFLIILAFNRCANAYKTAEATIQANKEKIEQCKTIKEQLHITAETIRQQEWYDTEFVNLLSAKWMAQNEYQKSLEEANKELQESLTRVYLGNFKITHYCVCSKCCGKSPTNPTYGITATGTLATAGRTIAVDPRKIPYGSKVVIDGHTYIAEDCGGLIKGNKIDICVSSHTEAYQRGVRNDVPVYLIEE